MYPDEDSGKILSAQLCSENELVRLQGDELPAHLIRQEEKQNEQQQQKVEIDILFKKTVAKPHIYYKFAH
jgi:hypothetical protein